jgi:hypothetical protein
MVTNQIKILIIVLSLFFISSCKRENSNIKAINFCNEQIYIPSYLDSYNPKDFEFEDTKIVFVIDSKKLDSIDVFLKDKIDSTFLDIVFSYNSDGLTELNNFKKDYKRLAKLRKENISSFNIKYDSITTLDDDFTMFDMVYTAKEEAYCREVNFYSSEYRVAIYYQTKAINRDVIRDLDEIIKHFVQNNPICERASRS